jgi:hypothetical protein
VGVEMNCYASPAGGPQSLKWSRPLTSPRLPSRRTVATPHASAVR